MIYCSVKYCCSNSSIPGVILHSNMKSIKTPNHPAYHWSTLWPLEVWVRRLYNSWWFCVHKLSMFIYLSMETSCAGCLHIENLPFLRRFIQYFSALPLRLDRTFVDDKWASYFRIYISVKPYTHFPVNNIRILSGFRIYFWWNIWAFVVKYIRKKGYGYRPMKTVSLEFIVYW